MDSSSRNLILIVDDTPTNLEVLSEALTDAGFEIAVATNGENAIKQIEYEAPDLILLDVMMPGIDGFETCYRLKSNPKTKDIPVIFITALTDTADQVKGFSLGAVDYISKPFQQAEVVVRIQTHMQMQKMRSALEVQNIRLKQEIQERTAAEASLQKLTQHLEKRVEERTQQLSQSLEKLQQTHVKLVQREKSATLGQLLAGIAHEINNPVNFIHANLHHANEYVQSLLELVKLYQTQFPDSTPEIKRKLEEVDLEFLIEDMPKVLSSMVVGSERICNVIKSLRTFSRHDEAQIKVVDLHEGIDSALIILDHRLKPKLKHQAIQVIKQYGKLPPVDCFAGKINQVFMNVLSNAIDALSEVVDAEHNYILSPTIRIQTEVVGSDRVAIRIADNGSGITKEVQERVFEPFFTTKAPGKGTGLGMSISRQIVTEHKGSLYCISSPGKGTEFVIEIPIRQPMLSNCEQLATVSTLEQFV